MEEELSSNAKDWFRVLLETEIGSERAAVDNETVWEAGSSDAGERYAHCMNATEHSDYLRFLEGLKARYCGTP